MKTYSKINIWMSFLVMLLFASCTEEIVRDPSPVANPNSANVYFSVTNSSSPVLGLQQSSFKVVIIREKKTAAQEVNLNVENVNGAIFEVPTKVSFAAGVDSVAIEIKVKDMELMKKYKLAISIDPEETKPYTIQKVYPRLELTVLKEDFAPFADGTYTSDFFEASWALTLEYSPATKIYRFKNCWEEAGYDLTFNWDEQAKPGEVNIIGTLNSAKDHTVVPTGVFDSKYGLISANYPLANKNYYSSATKTFTFPIKWTVAAGSFGVYPEKFVITKSY